MFFELVESLTDADRKALAANGVPSPRVSEWAHKKRLPTRTQALVLATVKGIDLDTLNRELTVIEAEQDAIKNQLFKKVVKTARSQWHFS